jgi:6-pyruvoyltetrahydropterin/6-carboxytetrahydropterin synthase
MWRIEKGFSFDAAHFLPHHHGQCKNLHGHRWNGKVILQSGAIELEGSSAGMVRDFGTIKSIIEFEIRALDHGLLNNLAGLSNPTAELIAMFLFERWQDKIPELVCVRIEESPDNAAEYWEDGIRG